MAIIRAELGSRLGERQEFWLPETLPRRRGQVAYSYRIFNSIEHVDLTEWQQVRSACNGSIFMDPRFIAAVEVSMKEVHKFWYIVIYDEGGAPVACTSASAMTLDVADFADPGLARIIRHTPLLFSRLRHWRLLIC